MNELTASLEQLREDPQLSRVFSPSDLCGLTLWLLRIKKGRSSEYRLLYGWILAQSDERSNPWSTYSPLKQKIGGFEFSICRISFQHSGQVIFDLVKQLCLGATLEVSCQQLMVDPPA